MRVAAIDVGTNTVLLLIADIDDCGSISTRRHEQRIPRLGEGVDSHGVLRPESVTRVLGVLREYRTVIGDSGPASVVVCGTSAVRDASNRGELVERVRRETGFELEVLTGEEEARWTYLGARSGVPETGRATVVDIGGGSTEITLGTATAIEQRISLNVGSVRITERYFRHDPPTHPELETAIEVIETEIDRAARFPFAGSSLIGVAGTATSLAILAQGLPTFDVRAVTNYRLSRTRVEELFRQLRSMHSDSIRTLSGVMEGRHDIIIAGTVILREILAHFKFHELIVSERGLRYGLVLREWERLTSV